MWFSFIGVILFCSIALFNIDKNVEALYIGGLFLAGLDESAPALDAMMVLECMKNNIDLAQKENFFRLLLFMETVGAMIAFGVGK